MSWWYKTQLNCLALFKSSLLSGLTFSGNLGVLSKYDGLSYSYKFKTQLTFFHIFLVSLPRGEHELYKNSDPVNLTCHINIHHQLYKQVLMINLTISINIINIFCSDFDNLCFILKLENY